MIDNLSFDFYTSGNSALHGLTPCSNTFAIILVQNCLCPPSSVSELIIKGETEFSSGLSSLGLWLIFSFYNRQCVMLDVSDWLIPIV